MFIIMYYDKYLKYKNKYLLLKNQIGGETFCDKAYKNILGTCWAVAIQTIFTFGQATSENLKKIMKSFNLQNKSIFINNKIQEVISNPQLNDFFSHDILDDKKHIFLKNILDKFIDRYYSKVFEINNLEKPKEIDDRKNPERCELVIADNFKKLFDNIFKNDTYGGIIISHFLFANLLSLFYLGYKVSFRNYYDNFQSINFDVKNDLGILITIDGHVCCLYICDGQQKYYNDNDKKVYNCQWIEILNSTNNLYVEINENLRLIDYNLYDKKHKLKKVKFLTVISKYTTDSTLDTDIKKILESNYSMIIDRDLQFTIGSFFQSGNSITQDKKKAIQLYRLAAAQGHTTAQLNLGLMYSNGDGVVQDKAEAVRLYRLAADQGYAIAQFNLGRMYYKGEGVTQDKAEALKWYRLSAEQGNKFAQFNLGYMFNIGDGVAQDKAEAVKWYHLAAENGYTVAQFNLGRMYYVGDGVAQNKTEAIKWYRLAAEQGYAHALSNLGRMYYLGDGVVQDIAEAERLFSIIPK